MFTHSTLSKEEELKPFRDHQNMLAGLDFVIALESDVFVHTSDGNMVKAVQGHWHFEDFKTTISRDRFSNHVLVILLMQMNFVKLVDQVDKGKITWKKFSSDVKKFHKDRRGAPYLTDVGGFPKLGESFYANALRVIFVS
ncbi:hypothetical protein Vadar_018695 [Vaccinium darrowii]|uniref:Uncharacterized protein n=1 Tax=Vaccinium darrowii TaxID=229202 RepID=A0ACB7Z4M4_9ERIC|nr:hypothetical protein Vadar_018695 [Vaccinium darrowii]